MSYEFLLPDTYYLIADSHPVTASFAYRPVLGWSVETLTMVVLLITDKKHKPRKTLCTPQLLRLIPDNRKLWAQVMGSTPGFYFVHPSTHRIVHDSR